MMNRDQMKYAIKRLEEIAREKTNKITADATKPGKTLTAGLLVNMIKSGKIKLKSDLDYPVSHYTDVSNIFDISGLNTSPIIDSKVAQPRHNAMKVEYDRVMDQLVLGDEKIALDLMNAFAKAKF